ncbi:hypothetical protein EJB05_15547, partial [Eragrostis curvula]
MSERTPGPTRSTTALPTSGDPPSPTQPQATPHERPESSAQGAQRIFKEAGLSRSGARVAEGSHPGCATHGKIVTSERGEADEGDPWGKRILNEDSDGEEEQVEDFFGQLWSIPSTPPRVRVRPRSTSNLVWVRKELAVAKSFGASDCYPARAADQWKAEVKRINFARDLCKHIVSRGTFAEVVKRKPMADQGGYPQQWGGYKQMPPGPGGNWQHPQQFNQNQFQPRPPQRQYQNQNQAPNQQQKQMQAQPQKQAPVANQEDVVPVHPRFPPQKKVQDLKDLPGIDLLKEGTSIGVQEWTGELDPFGELQPAWVTILGDDDGSKGDDDDDHQENDDEADDLDEGGEPSKKMDTGNTGENTSGQAKINKTTSSGKHGKTICMMANGQATEQVNSAEDMVQLNLEIDSEDQQSRWKDFLQQGSEEMSKQTCLQLLREMELDSDSEVDEVIEMEPPPEELKPMGRNLLFEPNQCSHQTEKDMVSEQVEPHEKTIKEKTKQKQWGPVMVERRSKRNKNGGGTIMEMAEELKKRHNLELPPRMGNSFAALSSDSLINKADDIGVSLGSNKNEIDDNINFMVNTEIARNEDFVDQNPEVLLPAVENLKRDILEETLTQLEHVIEELSPLKLEETPRLQFWETWHRDGNQHFGAPSADVRASSVVETVAHDVHVMGAAYQLSPRVLDCNNSEPDTALGFVNQ